MTNYLYLPDCNYYRCNFSEICIIAGMPCVIRFAIFHNLLIFFVFFVFSKFRLTNYLHLLYYSEYIWNFREIWIIVEIRGVTPFARLRHFLIFLFFLYFLKISSNYPHSRYYAHWIRNFRKMCIIVKKQALQGSPFYLIISYFLIFY